MKKSLMLALFPLLCFAVVSGFAGCTQVVTSDGIQISSPDPGTDETAVTAMAGDTVDTSGTAESADTMDTGDTTASAALVTKEPEIETEFSYTVVDTGQENCYGNSGGPIAFPEPGEAFYGQDAQYSEHEPSYRDNGDGTVTDLNTGLIWQQDPGEKKTFAEAVNGASTFSLAGYSDWRLPTIKELYSLILFSGVDVDPSAISANTPFIDTDYFVFEYGDPNAGERVIDSQYWSSTEYLGTTMNGNATVFGVNFADGRIKGYPRDLGPGGTTATHYVIYVRGNTDYGINDFSDNGDGTVTDTATGLMWSQADSGEGMNWEDALAWAQQKNAENYLGYNDWRLPNAKELESIVDYSRSPQETGEAAIDPVFDITPITIENGETNYPFFWTSTTHINQPGGSEACYVAFGDAMGYWMNEWTDVHGAGAQRSDPKAGDPSQYPQGFGPQGDAIRIYNYVRLVRDAS